MSDCVHHLLEFGKFTSARMNNSLLPSVSSQYYSTGNNDTISDINPMLIGSQINLHGNGFYMDSRLCNDDDHFKESFAVIPSESSTYYQPGPPSLVACKRVVDYPYYNNDNNNIGEDSAVMNTSNYNYMPQQQQLSSLISKKINSIPQYQVDYKTMKNSKKRPVEVSNKSCASECAIDKKMCLGCEQRQWHHHQANEVAREIPMCDRMPVRKSQKLSDRVTALQKLVSPYGKTDTASVLQEASISIKLLQDQIQNLFDRTNNALINRKPLQKTEEKQLDLRERGLCLVPVSLTQRLTKEDFD